MRKELKARNLGYVESKSNLEDGMVSVMEEILRKNLDCTINKHKAFK